MMCRNGAFCSSYPLCSLSLYPSLISLLCILFGTCILSCVRSIHVVLFRFVLHMSSKVPELPSLAAYGVGLVFYALHFPECVVPIRWTRCTDWIGGGSHAIWHLFIVLGIDHSFFPYFIARMIHCFHLQASSYTRTRCYSTAVELVVRCAR